MVYIRPSRAGKGSNEGQEFRMQGSALASIPHSIICPLCEAGELDFFGGVPFRCDSCARTVEDVFLRTLGQIVALPDAWGKHACECGHPEMRLLPDGVFHCPACASEVTPVREGGAIR
jgi:hypothetical protein